MKPSDQSTDTPDQRYSLRRRVAAKILPILVYTVVFPMILFVLPKGYMDLWLNLPPLLSGPGRWWLAGILILAGAFFAVWSIKAQKEFGKGTPMPLMPTQKLVVQGPYSLSRNPIFFGVISIFLGISILINSVSSLVVVLAFSVILLLFVKLAEEKELEKRFGADYLAHKKKTSFVIPIPPILKERKNENDC